MTGQPAARERLLDAVVEHFTADGLGEQSLRRIAEAVGTSHRMLLYHFGSKDGLFLAVAQEVERRTRSQVKLLSPSAAASTDEHDPAGLGLRRRPGAGRVRAALLRPLRPRPAGRRGAAPAARSRRRRVARHQRRPGVGRRLDSPAPRCASTRASGWPSCAGCCSTCWPRASGTEVGAALELFARAYAGAWWRRQPAGRQERRGRHQRARLVATPMAGGHDEGDRRPDLDGAAAVGDGGGVEVEDGAVVVGHGAEAPGPVEGGDPPVVDAGGRDGAGHVSGRSWRGAAPGCPWRPGRAAPG